MSLSNILFNSVATKLKLKTLTLQEEKFYVKNLLNQITFLKKSKEKNYKNLSVRKLDHDVTQQNTTYDQNLIVMYIINISFLKANTTIHVSDTKIGRAHV